MVLNWTQRYVIGVVLAIAGIYAWLLVLSTGLCIAQSPHKTFATCAAEMLWLPFILGVFSVALTFPCWLSWAISVWVDNAPHTRIDSQVSNLIADTK